MEEKIFTKEEVEENNYIIIDNCVYNFLDFEKKHPGGSKVLEYYRGKNGSETFHKIAQHHDKVKEALNNFKVGILDNNDI